MKCWSKRQTDGGRNGGFLEGNGERGWWGSTWIVVSFVQTSSVENGEIAQISSFSCAVFVMWSQSVCLAGTQKTHIYFCPPSLVSFLFISPLSLSVKGLLKPYFQSFQSVCYSMGSDCTIRQPSLLYSYAEVHLILWLFNCIACCLSHCPSQTSDCLSFGVVLWCLCAWMGSGWEVNTH